MSSRRTLDEPLIGHGGEQAPGLFVTLAESAGGVRVSIAGELELVCSGHHILKPLEITGLDRVFTIHGARDAALST